MNYLKLSYHFLSLVMISCSYQAKNISDGNVHSIDIIDNNRVNSSLVLTDLFSKVELIPLETSKQAILGRPRKLIVWNNRFFIHNTKQNGVAVFDENGTLTFSSKAYRGKGPDEYLSCGDFTINRVTGNIVIMDQFKSKIHEYNLMGDLVDQVNFPKSIVRINDFEILKENVYLFYSYSGFPNDKENEKNNSILVFDSKSNKVINGIAPLPENRLHVQTSLTSFYRLNDTLHFNHSFPSSNTYFINPEKYKLIKKYHYDFGHLNLDPNEIPFSTDPGLHSRLLNDLYSRYAIIFNMLENNRFLFLSYFYKNSNICVYDKAKGSTSIKQNQSGSKEQLPMPDAIDNNCLYYMCLPENISYFISPKILTDPSKAKWKTIQDTDNYVIIKYVLKND